MILGQSGGIAAALNAEKNLAVQKLPYRDLRERLLAQKQVLEIPELPPITTEIKAAKGIAPKTLEGIILDDTDAKLEGDRKHSSSFKPHINRGYVHDEQRGDGQSTASFRLKIPKSGKYDLRMAYSAHETCAKNAPIIIESDGQRTPLSFDQTHPLSAGDAFRSAGAIQLSANGETTITISNTGTEGFVILDALQLMMIAE